MIVLIYCFNKHTIVGSLKCITNEPIKKLFMDYNGFEMKFKMDENIKQFLN